MICHLNDLLNGPSYRGVRGLLLFWAEVNFSNAFSEGGCGQNFRLQRVLRLGPFRNNADESLFFANVCINNEVFPFLFSLGY